MADNLTGQVRSISDVTQAIARGDMSRRVHVHAAGEIQLLKDTINDMVARLDDWSLAVKQVARDVGVDGKMGGQAEVRLPGRWQEVSLCLIGYAVCSGDFAFSTAESSNRHDHTLSRYSARFKIALPALPADFTRLYGRVSMGSTKRMSTGARWLDDHNTSCAGTRLGDVSYLTRCLHLHLGFDRAPSTVGSFLDPHRLIISRFLLGTLSHRTISWLLT